MFLTVKSKLNPYEKLHQGKYFPDGVFIYMLNSLQHILCLMLICNLNHIAWERLFVLIFMTIIDKVKR